MSNPKDIINQNQSDNINQEETISLKDIEQNEKSTNIKKEKPKSRSGPYNMSNSFITIAVLVGAAVLISIVLMSSSFTTIEAGHVGVVKRFGAVKDGYLKPGFNTKTPFVDSVIEIDARMSSVHYSSLASSKDLQQVTTAVTFQYYLIQSFIPLLYKTIGLRDIVEHNVLEPAIAESLKAVTSNFTAEELVTKRPLVKTKITIFIEDFIDSSLEPKGLKGAIKISNLAITDFRFSEDFNRAIEQKVKAEQEALQAVKEGDKKVTQAKAEATRNKITADAESYKISKMAAARAEAIKLEADALKNNPELIQLRLIETWDGVLPTFTGGNGIPMLDVASMMNNKKASHPVSSRRKITN